jgi:sporulation protein YtfJ
MAEHPIQGIMSSALHNIKEMIDVNTIVGTPVTAQDGTVIIPVSRVAFGFGAGGSEFGGSVVKEDGLKSNFGGGSGAGVSINPVAFLVVSNGNVRLLTLSSSSTSVDKVIDMVPEIITKFKDAFSKKENKTEKFTSDIDEIVITD